MSERVADFMMHRLSAWGIRRIFGYPGDGINALISAIDRTDKQIDFIQVRHEEQAAFMASAHAKFTNELGVCLATSGPGAIHLLNGLYDAKMDHQPVLAIVGQASTMALGGRYQQEVDLNVLFKDVASEYCFTISNPVATRHVVDREFTAGAVAQSACFDGVGHSIPPFISCPMAVVSSSRVSPKRAACASISRASRRACAVRSFMRMPLETGRT